MKSDKPKNPVGRPWFNGRDELDVLRKLEQAFAIGCTNREACIYSDITEAMYYNYVKEHDGLAEKFALLKDRPTLKARTTLVASLGDPEHAKWYLKHKKNDEFSEKVVNDGNVTVKYITLD